MALTEPALTTAVICCVFPLLAFIAVCLRLWTRLFIIRAPGAEDWVITASMLCAAVMTICIGLQVQYGLGQHAADVSPENQRKLLQAFWVSIAIYCASIGLTKTAVLLQFQRVFVTPTFQRWCWTLIVIIVVYTFATVVACIFVCVPVQAFWTGEKAKCIDEFASWFSNAAINIVTDLIIIVLPMPMVRNLNLRSRQKQALMAIFAVGGLVCVISITRLRWLFAFRNTHDTTYDNAGTATWSVIETNISIICACLPVLRPLLARWIPGVTSSHSHQHSHPHNFNGNGYHYSTQTRKGSLANAFEGSPLETLRGWKQGRGTEALSGEGDDDRIKVVTVVDVEVDKRRGTIGEDSARNSGRDTSTESLVRDIGHVV